MKTMKIRFLVWLVWGGVLGLSGCSKESLTTYEGAAMVNFDYNKMELKKDSVNVAYGFVADEYRLINLELIVTGYPEANDREVKLSVTSEDGAQAGVHYELQEEVVIPAGEVMATVPLKVLRPAELMENPVSFSVKIVNSLTLEAGIRTTLFVSVSDDIPDQWIGDENWFMGSIEDYFGKCSKTKYLFVYQVLGIWDFSAYSYWGMMADSSKFTPAKRIVKEKLAEYEAANGPLVDPIEGRVTFPD